VPVADNLPPSSADVTESGSLNLPEPSGPHRPVMGLLYLFYCIVMYQLLIAVMLHNYIIEMLLMLLSFDEACRVMKM
jgi:hypothetical protein